MVGGVGVAQRFVGAAMDDLKRLNIYYESVNWYKSVSACEYGGSGISPLICVFMQLFPRDSLRTGSAPDSVAGCYAGPDSAVHAGRARQPCADTDGCSSASVLSKLTTCCWTNLESLTICGAISASEETSPSAPCTKRARGGNDDLGLG